jgi:hypothetical protein
MKTVKVKLRSVNEPSEVWDEEWSGRTAQEITEDEVESYVNRVINDWNEFNEDNKREVVSFSFVDNPKKIHTCPDCGVVYKCNLENGECNLPEESICGDCSHKRASEES